MAQLRFLTAGESHGPALTCIAEGMPAGVPILAEQIDVHLARRQQGYGRGGRMKIETDRAQISSGIRHGFTFGAPITLTVINRDYDSWMEGEPILRRSHRMHPIPKNASQLKFRVRPRRLFRWSQIPCAR